MVEIEAKELKEFWEKSKGLMGKDTPQAVFFTTRWGIHTFFMKFAIDVVILDKNNKVVSLADHLLPNRILIWNPKHYKVLELPSGIIRQKKINRGCLVRMILV